MQLQIELTGNILTMNGVVRSVHWRAMLILSGSMWRRGYTWWQSSPHDLLIKLTEPPVLMSLGWGWFEVMWLSVMGTGTWTSSIRLIVSGHRNTDTTSVSVCMCPSHSLQPSCNPFLSSLSQMIFLIHFLACCYMPSLAMTFAAHSLICFQFTSHLSSICRYLVTSSLILGAMYLIPFF